MKTEDTIDPTSLTFDDRGLLPVVAQDEATGAVLMVAWANAEAIEQTQATGRAHFWSRSRQELWMKGGTSGNTLDVSEIRVDCDRDTLLYRVYPAGPACHRGTRTCFEPNAAQLELGWLYEVLESRRAVDSQESYTARLLAAGLPRVAQKVGEEAVETVIAALASEPGQHEALVEEGADLLYHLLVLLTATGVEPEQLARKLQDRHTQRGTP